MLSKNEMNMIEKVVEKARNNCGKRSRYNSYTPEERAKIGKYASENGATRAARHFSQSLERSINESTARKFKSEYLEQLKSVRKSLLSIFRQTLNPQNILLGGKRKILFTQNFHGEHLAFLSIISLRCSEFNK